MSTNSQISWLKNNASAVKWVLVGPNLKNQFDVITSDDALESYIHNKAALEIHCSIHAIMDREAILKLCDLTKLRLETEHPCLYGVSLGDVIEYLEESGIWKELEQQFQDFQEGCSHELKERRAGGTSCAAW